MLPLSSYWNCCPAMAPRSPRRLLPPPLAQLGSPRRRRRRHSALGLPGAPGPVWRGVAWRSVARTPPPPLLLPAPRRSRPDTPLAVATSRENRTRPAEGPPPRGVRQGRRGVRSRDLLPGPAPWHAP